MFEAPAFNSFLGAVKHYSRTPVVLHQTPCLRWHSNFCSDYNASVHLLALWAFVLPQQLVPSSDLAGN